MWKGTWWGGGELHTSGSMDIPPHIPTTSVTPPQALPSPLLSSPLPHLPPSHSLSLRLSLPLPTPCFLPNPLPPKKNPHLPTPSCLSNLFQTTSSPFSPPLPILPPLSSSFPLFSFPFFIYCIFSRSVFFLPFFPLSIFSSPLFL